MITNFMQENWESHPYRVLALILLLMLVLSPWLLLDWAMEKLT